ncbi:hypothetical protein C8R48DRAFT_778671 [Suillus tomentosus]|nr:hypothetical protein C8R48DRAFT_778671 [Suillus tomentosus]
MSVGPYPIVQTPCIALHLRLSSISHYRRHQFVLSSPFPLFIIAIFNSSDLRPPPALLLPMPPVTPPHEPFLWCYHPPQIPKPRKHGPLHELLLASPQIPVLGVLSHSGASPMGNLSSLLSQPSDALALPLSARKGLSEESPIQRPYHVCDCPTSCIISTALTIAPPALFLPKPPVTPPHRLFMLYHPPQIPKAHRL